MSNVIIQRLMGAPQPPPELPPYSMQFSLESEAATGTNPWSFGLWFDDGEITGSIDLDTGHQSNDLRRYASGCLKHVSISGETPFVQNVPVVVTVTPLVGYTPQVELTVGDIASAAPQASYQAGALGTVNLSSLFASPFEVELTGPKMIRAWYTAALDADLRVWFEVSLWASGRMFIRAWAENGKLDNGAGALFANVTKTYVPTITIGGVVVYNNGGASITHYAHQSVIGEGWIGGDPQVTISHDPDQMIDTKKVPNYYWRAPSEATLNGLLQTYTPLSSGSITPNMGQGGFQASIGLLPKWDALYCTTGDKRALKSVLANAKHLRSYGIAWRSSATNRVPKPSDFPTWTVSGPGAGGVSSWVTGALQWEAAHLAQVGYIAYLATGDRFYLETMAMNAAMCFFTIRSSKGSGVNRRLNPGQIRGIGWCECAVGHYVSAAPDGDPIAEDYRTLLANDLAHWANQGPYNPAASQLGYPIAIGTHTLGFNLTKAPFEYHFWQAVVGHLWDIDCGFASTADHLAIRDWMYKGIVGILGGAGPDNFCYIEAALFIVCLSDTFQNDPEGELGPEVFYATWGLVWTMSGHTSVWPNTVCGPGLDGYFNGIGGGLTATEYWANLMPSIAAAVDHLAPGAAASHDRLTGDTLWPTLAAADFSNVPNFGIMPRDWP